MIITQSYLKKLVGRKIILTKSGLIDFHRSNAPDPAPDPVGRILDVTDDGRFIVKWYTIHHNQYDVNIFEDEFIIND